MIDLILQLLLDFYVKIFTTLPQITVPSIFIDLIDGAFSTLAWFGAGYPKTATVLAQNIHYSILIAGILFVFKLTMRALGR